MRWIFDTIKGRVVAVLVLFLSASHVLGLWLYAQKSEEAATLLHDALLAEQIALVVRLAERLPAAERPAMLQALSGPTVRIALTPADAARQSLPEGTRAHAFEHLLGVFLDRPTQESIRLAYSPGGRIEGLDSLLAKVRTSVHGERDHLPVQPLAEIHALGAVNAQIALADGSWVHFVAPLLTVSPFSPFKLGIPLAAMLLSVLVIRSVREHATVPVIIDGDGNCHVYVDAAADLDAALDIVVNAKTHRPSVCNAAESLVVHEAIADEFLPRVCDALIAEGVELLGDAGSRQRVPSMGEATAADFASEFLALRLSVATVPTLDAAIDHVNRNGSGHTEAIVTRDLDAARRFTHEVDAAAVVVNASTRFTDGEEFGFGAEIGISTQKLHARGPMGLRELTTYKYLIWGDGQVRS